MARLIRKITLAKWRSPLWASPQLIPADAISVDLKTTGNTLSFWRVGSEPAGEDNAVLALIGSLSNIDAIDIAFLEEEVLSGISMVNTKGITAASSFASLHVDLVEINHDTLTKTAQALANEIFSKRTRRLTRGTVVRVILEGIDKGLLNKESLHEKVRIALDREIAK